MSTAAADPRSQSSTDSNQGSAFPRADKLLSYLIVACGIFTASIGATQIVASHSLVPMWDEWTEIDAIAMAPHHQPPLSWLWAQHNEHRIVFSRLLLLADIHIFHGKHWISFLYMLAIQTLFLLCLAWMLRFCGLKGTLWRAIIGLGAFCLFSPSQWENFGWAFQPAFLLPGFFLVLALSAILKYHRSVEQLQPRWIYLALSILAASAATYSNANGMLLWPLLLLVAIVLIPRRKVIASYVGFGIVLIASYLYHYVGPSRHASPLNSLRHPLRMCRYIAGYLGIILPPGLQLRSWLAVSSGMFALLVALAIVMHVLSRPKREPLQLALLGLMFFSIATAFLTALGRLNFGLEQAFESRYQTYNLLFWFSTVSLLLLIVDRTNPRMRTAALAVTSAAMLLAFFAFPLGLKASRTRTQQAEAAATALLSGVPNADALRVLYPDPALVWRDIDYLRQQHLFMFSDPKNNQIGQLRSSTYRTSPQQWCQGQVQNVRRVRPDELLADQNIEAVQISGSAIDRLSRNSLRTFVFTSSDTIVGYGASIAEPFTTGSQFPSNQNPDNWLGFFRLPHDASPIDIYAIDTNATTACHLATVEVPSS